MHLVELLERRPVPAAGAWLMLTRRCPLACAHCSTASTLAAAQHAEAPFRRLVGSMTPADRPQFVLFTGGEPTLRPGLVTDLAEAAARVGVRTYLLTGLYVARLPAVPPAVSRAFDAVDHVAVSLDRWHETEVPRAEVFRVLRDLLDRGRDVSLQIAGTGPDDPYLADVTAAVRRAFGDRVPALVTRLVPVGRARRLLPLPTPSTSDSPDPCGFAAWPVVRPDGVVVACGNQDVVDAPAPPAHLRLGDAAVDGWPELRRRLLDSAYLTAVRGYGPCRLAARPDSGGCCASCRANDPAVADAVRPTARVVADAVVAAQVAAGFARLHAVSGYADLASLGAGRG